VERGVLTGIGAFRWAAWLWMLLVLVAQDRLLTVAWLAWTLVALSGVVTIWLTAVRGRAPAALLDPLPVLSELAVGAALMICDGVVFAHGHVGSSESALPTAWPLAGVLSAGVAFGERAGLAAGLTMGLARLASAPVNGVRLAALTRSTVISFLSTFVLYALAGAVAGYAVRLARQSDDEVARARAREEVSRTLHDGVLQTLALVERRVSDPQLAALAREQERELRGFLAGYGSDRPAGRPAGGSRRVSSRRRAGVSPGQLEERLRRVSARLEDTYGGRVDVLIAEDLPMLDASKVDALTGAVGEALVNAGKHGHATRATVFVEPVEQDRDGVFCSVKDNGDGFDPATTTEGLGIRGSIRNRIERIGGRVEISSAPGRGAEVRLWL